MFGLIAALAVFGAAIAITDNSPANKEIQNLLNQGFEDYRTY